MGSDFFGVFSPFLAIAASGRSCEDSDEESGRRRSERGKQVPFWGKKGQFGAIWGSVMGWGVRGRVRAANFGGNSGGFGAVWEENGGVLGGMRLGVLGG